MIFETRQEWEVRDPNIQLLGGAGVRRYPFVRVSLNFILFHVDFILEGEDFWQRYIFFSVHDVLAALQQKDIKTINVSLQSRRCDNKDNEYCISTINEIVKIIDKYNQPMYIFNCKNGKTYYGSDSNCLNDVNSDKEVVYFNNNI